MFIPFDKVRSRSIRALHILHMAEVLIFTTSVLPLNDCALTAEAAKNRHKITKAFFMMVKFMIIKDTKKTLTAMLTAG